MKVNYQFFDKIFFDNWVQIGAKQTAHYGPHEVKRAFSNVSDVLRKFYHAHS